jgi:hypothetical protein
MEILSETVYFPDHLIGYRRTATTVKIYFTTTTCDIRSSKEAIDKIVRELLIAKTEKRRIILHQIRDGEVEFMIGDENE